MRLPSYLIKSRHGIYYFRIVVPQKFRPFLKRPVFRKSLELRDPSEAKLLARFMWVQFQSLLMRIEAGSGNDGKGALDGLLLKNQMGQRLQSNLTKLAQSVVTEAATEVIPAAGPLGIEQKVEFEGQKQSSQKSLSEAINLYFQERKRTNRWTERSEDEVYRKLQLIVEVMGDVPCGSVSGNDVSELKRILLNLPPNRKIRGEYRGKAIKEVAAMKHERVLDAKTLQDYFFHIRAFFRWGHDEGLFPDYSARLRFELPSREAKEADRGAFSKEELERLFKSPEFVEQKGNRTWKDYMFWVPLIAAFTGARQNEICQLHLQDVYQEEGVWLLDIKTDTPDKRLKQQTSERRVPIHETLIRLGFLRFVENRKAQGHQRLFPELPLRKDGYGRKVSRGFARLMESLGIKHVFHDFRHSAVTCLQQKGVSEEYIAALVGHRNDNITIRVYGSTYPLKELQARINLLDYGVDFRHLEDPKANRYV